MQEGGSQVTKLCRLFVMKDAAITWHIRTGAKWWLYNDAEVTLVDHIAEEIGQIQEELLGECVVA